MPSLRARFGSYGLFISALVAVAGCDAVADSAGQVARAPTKARAQKGPGGNLTFKRADGLTAELAPAGDAMELRFSDRRVHFHAAARSPLTALSLSPDLRSELP